MPTTKKPAAKRGARALPRKPAVRKRPATSGKAPAIKKVVAAAPSDLQVVRDRFKMSIADLDLLKTLKERCLALEMDVKKSAIIRAGIHMLTSLAPDALAERMRALPALDVPRKKKRA